MTNYQPDVELGEKEVGSRMCVRSDEDRYAMLQFTRLPKANLNSSERLTAIVAFDVVTWEMKP